MFQDVRKSIQNNYWSPIHVCSSIKVCWSSLTLVVQSFLSTAEKEYQAVLQLHRSAMTEFRVVAKFFGEDPQTMRLDDFFAAFADFIKNFQVCLVQHTANSRCPCYDPTSVPYCPVVHV